ncbi:MAG: HAD family hydrolase [Erysipelotrichaceae bacterium]
MKIFISDIDSTIYSHNNNKICDRTLKALHQLQKSDHLIVYATARVLYGMKEILTTYDLIDDKTYIIGSNGSEIVKANDFDNYLYHDIFSIDTVRLLEELSFKYHCNLVLEQKDTLLTNGYDQYIDEDRKCLPIKVLVTNSVFDEFSLVTSKISLTTTKERRDDVYEDLVSNYNHLFTATKAGDGYIDITPLNNNKLSGVKHLLDHLNLSMKDVYYIGDNHNDLEMIKSSYVGGCVGNGEQCCLDVADFQALSCEDGGVGQFIEKYLLND